MATTREISLKDIDFSGHKTLFASGDKKLYPDEIRYNQDVPALVQKCIELQDLLFKFPIIPLKAYFESDGNEKLFIVKDKRTHSHWFVEDLKIYIKENNALDIEKLDTILKALKDVEIMKIYREGLKAGGSLLKMILRGSNYTDKYVNHKGKARIGHMIFTKIKAGVGVIVGVSFITTFTIFGPEVAIPLFALIVSA